MKLQSLHHVQSYPIPALHNPPRGYHAKVYRLGSMWQVDLYKGARTEFSGEMFAKHDATTLAKAWEDRRTRHIIWCSFGLVSPRQKWDYLSHKRIRENMSNI